MAEIGSRKEDHLDLAARGDVAFRERSTLLDDVCLVHDALPELALDEVSLKVRILGRSLRAPLLVAAMTGGTDRARSINRDLAAAAEARGWGFCLGSQRAMHRDATARATYEVRDVAPSVLLLGNLGMVQAAELPTSALRALAEAVGADALAIHLNPAMELIQAEGDRDFRGGLDLFRRLVGELGLPVVAKETGSGLSASAAERLAAVGVRHADVSGAGGTSWVAVEMHRASDARRRLGETFREWGIPTAASVALVAARGFSTVIATGGVRHGLDAARALALGAHAVGIARPLLQAWDAGGKAAVEARMAEIEAELKTALLLTGARDVAALRDGRHFVRGELREWLQAFPAR